MTPVSIFSKNIKSLLKTIGRSVLYKVVSEIFLQKKYEYQYKNMIKPSSEPFKITKEIFQEVDAQVRSEGKKFILVFLPSRVIFRNIKRKKAIERIGII